MPIKFGEQLELFSVEEIADKLNVQEKTVRKLFRDGVLKGRKLARRWYITEEDLKAYFQSDGTQSP